MIEFDRSVQVPSRFATRGPSQSPRIEAALPAPILRSWQRCAAFGLDRETSPPIEPLPAQMVRHATARSEVFKRRCRGALETLYAEIRASDGIAILTDSEGLVLDALGSPGFADRAAQIALRPGVSWAEPVSGTNAIGTAAVERRFTEVRGAEHFLKRNGVLTCSAMPIFDAEGQLLGIFDLSGHAQSARADALSLLQHAADSIEHGLFEGRLAGCDVLRLHKDSTVLGTVREGILVFRDHILVGANRHGLGLLGIEWDALGQRTYRSLFPSERTIGADARVLRDARGEVVHARAPQRDRPLTHISALAPQPAPQPKPSAHVLDDAGAASLRRAVRLLDAGVPLLVQGETGTGKEVFSRAAHAASARASKPFVAINCTALPESLIEAELFGYEAGAFTGARRGGAKGLLREADGGLLFLDEIGDMPAGLQPRLLRVLQEREVVPVGGTRATPIDVTLICATHRDLMQLVEDGSFRADLYFRIASYTIELPPLRTLAHRLDAVRSVWSSLAPEMRKVQMSPACEAALAAYPWPGNFRQLAGSLKAMLALAEPGETLDVDALPAPLRQLAMTSPAAAAVVSTKRGFAKPGNLDDITKTAMREALAAAQGNVSEAARRLGISRSTLYRRCLAEASTR